MGLYKWDNLLLRRDSWGGLLANSKRCCCGEDLPCCAADGRHHAEIIQVELWGLESGNFEVLCPCATFNGTYILDLDFCPPLNDIPNCSNFRYSKVLYDFSEDEHPCTEPVRANDVVLYAEIWRKVDQETGLSSIWSSDVFLSLGINPTRDICFQTNGEDEDCAYPRNHTRLTDPMGCDNGGYCSSGGIDACGWLHGEDLGPPCTVLVPHWPRLLAPSGAIIEMIPVLP